MQQHAFRALHALADLEGDQHSAYWDGRTNSCHLLPCSSILLYASLSCVSVQEQPCAGNFRVGRVLWHGSGLKMYLVLVPQGLIMDMISSPNHRGLCTITLQRAQSKKCWKYLRYCSSSMGGTAAGMDSKRFPWKKTPRITLVPTFGNSAYWIQPKLSLLYTTLSQFLAKQNGVHQRQWQQ